MAASGNTHGLGSFGDTLRRGLAVPSATRMSLRAFATSREFCAIAPSPLAAAIMDASCGIGITTIDEVIPDAFGPRTLEAYSS